jgi:hypothetical protein
LFVLIGLGSLVGGCASSEGEDDAPPPSYDAITSAKAKPIREAVKVTCTAAGKDQKFDFFFTDDDQLRGTLLTGSTTELAVVKPDARPESLKSVGGDDTVLRGDSGPFYSISRFFPRFITDTDASFVASHSSLKIVTEAGAATEAKCKVDAPVDSAAKLVKSITDMIPPSEYKGHGKTQAKLCSTVVESSGGKVSISIKPRKDDGSLDKASSSFTLTGDSKINQALTSAKKDVLWIHATSTEDGKPATRALVVDTAAGASTPRVTIVSFGANGGSTNFCDM